MPEIDRSVDGSMLEQERGSFRQLLLYFLQLGAIGFGGPVATVGYMQRDLVESRHWIDREEFLNGVALGQTMPGPLAAQVCMWVGYLRRGFLGALAVAGAFIVPSFLLVIVLAVLYVRFQGLPIVQALFYGIAPGVMAIIVIATIRLARLTNRHDIRLWVISAVITAVTALTGAEIALLVIAAGLFILLWDAPPKWLRDRLPSLALIPSLPWKGSLAAVATGVASLGVLGALALFFLEAGTFIFGSGLAIVPFLREGVVNQQHWLNERQFLDAVAIGLITPGPVVITAAFIGYLVAGLAGALVATLAIFTPIYLGVVIPGRWFVRHRNNLQLKGFVKGATAAAAGAIAGATIVLARQAIIDAPTALVAGICLLILWRFKVREPYVVLACAVVGIALHH